MTRVVAAWCAGCGGRVEVVDSDSLYKPTGGMHGVYHGTCYDKKDGDDSEAG